MEDIVSNSVSYAPLSNFGLFDRPGSGGQPPSHPTSTGSPLLGTGSASPPGGGSSAQSVSNKAITQLIDDLRNTDLQVRLNSFRKIQLIAQALGPARTRGELIPYLGEFCDDDDEVLLLLAAHLGEMVDAVGGSEHAHVLLAPLEQLAGSEETAVREKAVQALGKIVEQVSEHTLMEHVLPLLRRTANADWFTSRISATALFPLIYPRLPQPSVDDAVKKELRALYANLCKKEETPMVKRAAAANLGQFAAILDSKLLLSEFHGLLLKLSRDEIDSVRLLVVQSCVQICKVYVRDTATRQEHIAKIKPILLALAEDSSWRVRYMLADKFIELCSTIAAPASAAAAAGPAGIAAVAASSASGAVPSSPWGQLRDEDLTSCFLKLLEDPELEVRTSATLKCGEFARLLGPAKTMEKFFWIGSTGKPITPPPAPQTNSAQFGQQAGSQSGPRLPPLKAIVSDTSAGALHTKSALASIILQFTGVLSSATPTPAAGATPVSGNALLIEHLLPLILNLLNDEHAEVRLGLIAKLGEEGSEAQQQQQQSGGASSGDSIKNVLSIEVLSSSLLPALTKLASDLKWRTRLQTIHLIPNLAAYFQADFFNAKLFDVVMAWLGDSIWSIREAAILNLVRLTQLFGPQWAVQRLLPKLRALAADNSYVFRLTSVFAMKELAHVLGAQIVTTELLPTVLQLAKDVVPNVRFNVARMLGYLVKEQLVTGAPASGAAPGSSNGVADIEKALLEMQNDDNRPNRDREPPDADVKYCAQQALKEAFGRS